MQVWRLCKACWAQSAFSGEGARRVGGRWNHKGVAVVYAARSLSLAAIELFVHLEPEDRPDDLVQISAEIPAGVSRRKLTLANLPKNWRAYPAPTMLQTLGSEWVRAGESAILELPSAVIPNETNVLVNPNHADFQDITINPPEPFFFDPRMWK
ncbi:MAG: RES family NAD+ phosphorylase [Cyanobacteria bacterium J06639_1]